MLHAALLFDALERSDCHLCLRCHAARRPMKQRYSFRAAVFDDVAADNRAISDRSFKRRVELLRRSARVHSCRCGTSGFFVRRSETAALLQDSCRCARASLGSRKPQSWRCSRFHLAPRPRRFDRVCCPPDPSPDPIAAHVLGLILLRGLPGSCFPAPDAGWKCRASSLQPNKAFVAG